jgi:hypothetical protein
MAEAKRATQKRSQRNVRALVVEEALSTWVAPTIGAILLGAAMLLDALAHSPSRLPRSSQSSLS